MHIASRLAETADFDIAVRSNSECVTFNVAKGSDVQADKRITFMSPVNDEDTMEYIGV